MFIYILLYGVAFLVIWFSAGLIVNSIDRLSHRLNLSSFAVSFFVLGLLTSVPEMSVGVNSILQKDPEIFVGNLIGGIVIIFLLIIPLLALFGNGVRLAHQMNGTNLVFALLVIAAPSIFTLDGSISLVEGVLSILLYVFLVYAVEKRKGLLEQVKDKVLNLRNHVLEEIYKVIAGIIIVFFASSYIVESTIYFSEVLTISPFLLSLVLVSFGTNLPELSIVVRSLILKKKEVALGDYLGSAAANTVIFGVLILLNKQTIFVDNNFMRTPVFIIGGLLFFFLFSRSKNQISRSEAVILIFFYAVFLLVEVFA